MWTICKKGLPGGNIPGPCSNHQYTTYPSNVLVICGNGPHDNGPGPDQIYIESIHLKIAESHNGEDKWRILKFKMEA